MIIWFVYYSLSPQELQSSTSLLQSQLEEDCWRKFQKFINNRFLLLRQSANTIYHQIQYINYQFRYSQIQYLTLHQRYNYNSFYYALQFRKMECSFCHRRTENTIYACPRHEQVTACFGCQQYQCDICRSSLRKVTLQFCVRCHSHHLQQHMFGEDLHRFCYNCCLQSFRKHINSKKVILINHIVEVEKGSIYAFLKSFCYKCRKNIRLGSIRETNYVIEGIESNICTDCNIGGKTIKGSLKEHRDTSKSPQKFENSRVQRSYVKKEVVKEGQTKFSDRFLKCNICGFTVLHEKDGYVDRDVVVCNFCKSKSDEEQRNLNSNSKNYQKRVFQESRYKQTLPQRKSQYYSPYEEERQATNYDYRKLEHLNRRFPEEVNSRKQHQPEFQDSYNNSSSRKINESRSTVTTSRANRSGEDSIYEKIPENTKTHHQRSIVKCYECRSEIQISDVIWDEQDRKNVCSRCHDRKYKYQTAEPQIWENERQKLNTVKRAESWDERILIQPAVQHERRKQRLNRQERIQEMQNENEDYENCGRNRKKNEQNVEPTIIDDDTPEKRSKVKRMTSWNQEIILEPVADHLERKNQSTSQKEQKVVYQKTTYSQEKKVVSNNSPGQKKKVQTQRQREREREYEKIRRQIQLEEKKLREIQQEKQKFRLIEIQKEREKLRILQRQRKQKQHRLQRQKQIERQNLERQRQMQIKRLVEKERQLQRLKQLQKQRQIERQRQERQRKLEKEKQLQRELQILKEKQARQKQRQRLRRQTQRLIEIEKEEQRQIQIQNERLHRQRTSYSYSYKNSKAQTPLKTPLKPQQKQYQILYNKHRQTQSKSQSKNQNPSYPTYNTKSNSKTKNPSQSDPTNVQNLRRQAYQRYYKHDKYTTNPNYSNYGLYEENYYNQQQKPSTYYKQDQNSQHQYNQSKYASPQYSKAGNAYYEKQTLSKSRPSYTTKQSQSNPGFKNSQAKTEYNERMSGRKDDFIGYKIIQRSQQKNCEFCKRYFTVSYKDYYIKGNNVCLPCFDQFNNELSRRI